MSSGTTPTRNLINIGSGSITIFGNYNVISNSPAGALFYLVNGSTLQIVYGFLPQGQPNFQLDSTGTGVIAYVIPSLSPDEEINISVISISATTQILNSRTHTGVTLTNQVEYLGFTIFPGAQALIIQVHSNKNLTLYICYVMVWEQVTPQPQPKFFLDKTYNYLLTQETAPTKTNPNGVFPKNNVTRSLVSTTVYTTSEDQYSIITN